MIKKCNENVIKEFKDCKNVLSALGDETRQAIIVYMMINCDGKGFRACELSDKVSASRTAISHHLKVLKENNVVDMRKEGTKNYYYINKESSSLKTLIRFFKDLEEYIK